MSLPVLMPQPWLRLADDPEVHVLRGPSDQRRRNARRSTRPRATSHQTSECRPAPAFRRTGSTMSRLCHAIANFTIDAVSTYREHTPPTRGTPPWIRHKRILVTIRYDAIDAMHGDAVEALSPTTRLRCRTECRANSRRACRRVWNCPCHWAGRCAR